MGGIELKTYSEWIAYLKTQGIDVLPDAQDRNYYESLYKRKHGYTIIITHDGLEGIRADVEKRNVILIAPFVTNSFENDRAKYIPEEFYRLIDDRKQV